MTQSHVKARLKIAPQKLNFVMAKIISKSYTLDCSCKFPCTLHIVTHSYTPCIVTRINIVSFSLKTTLRETNNILFSKNYWKLDKMNAKF